MYTDKALKDDKPDFYFYYVKLFKREGLKHCTKAE